MEKKIIVKFDWQDVARINLGETGFKEYREKVFKALDSLQSNKYYDLMVLPIYRRETFIGVCMEYMQQNPGFELSSDNSKIYNRN